MSNYCTQCGSSIPSGQKHVPCAMVIPIMEEMAIIADGLKNKPFLKLNEERLKKQRCIPSMRKWNKKGGNM